MALWLFALMIPALMIFFGWFYSRYEPGDINSVIGYRTKRSMKNRDTWEFAHRCFAKYWLRAGLVMLPLSVIPAFFLAGKSVDIIGIAVTAVMLVQLIPLLGCIPYTEARLRREFDEDGNRRA